MRRSYQAFLVVVTFACALALAPLLVEAQVPINLLELDGNTADDAGVTGFDWANASGQPVVGAFFNTPDPVGGLQMTQGTKDIHDVSQWVFKTVTNVTPKDDLIQVLGASVTDPAPLPGTSASILYFGASRGEASGTTSFGFWLLQDDITFDQNNGNSFSDDQHIEGDTLVVVDVGGNTIEGIRLFRWLGGNGAAGSLQEVGTLDTNAATCATTGIIDGHYDTNICGAVSADGLFLEIGINFGGLLGDLCVTNVMTTTRTSNTASASVKNFHFNSFELCDIDITKTCDAGTTNATDTGFVWSFSGTVSSSVGTLFNVRVIDAGSNQIIDTPEGGALAGDDILFTIGTLTQGQPAMFNGTFETLGTTPNPASNLARAEASVTSGGQRTVFTTSNLSTCPPVIRSPDLAINKCCQPRLAVVSNTVQVAIDVSGAVCNVGTITLTNVSVVNDNGTPGNLGDDTTLLSGVTLLDTDDPNTPADDRCASYSGSYFPSSVNVGSNITDPDGAAFQDTVRANGTSVLFGAATEETASATCSLCGQANCPVPPPLPLP